MNFSQQNYFTKTDSYFSVKSRLYVRLGCGDTKWYHHDLDGHHHNPDGHKDGIFTEKYGAVQVRFGEVVLLCLANINYNYVHNWLVTIAMQLAVLKSLVYKVTMAIDLP